MRSFESVVSAVSAGKKAVARLAASDVGAGAALCILGAVVALLRAAKVKGNLSRDAFAGEMKRVGCTSAQSSRAARVFIARQLIDSLFFRQDWRLTLEQAQAEADAGRGAVDSDGLDVPASCWDVLAVLASEYLKAREAAGKDASDRGDEELEARGWLFVLGVQDAFAGVGAREIRSRYVSDRKAPSAEGEGEQEEESASETPSVEVVLAALPHLSDADLARVAVACADLLEARRIPADSKVVSLSAAGA